MEINGDNILFTDQRPIMLDGRVFVPLRDICENINAQIKWNAKTNTVTIQRNDRRIAFQVSNKKMTWRSQYEDSPHDVDMDVNPIIKNGRIMLPIRYLMKYLDDDSKVW